MSEQIYCPVCESSSIKESKETTKIKESFVDSVEVEVTNYLCLDCGAEGDFTGQNDDKYNRALETLKSKVVNCIIEDFDKNNISMASIERALDLPQRTLTKWKNGVSSPTATGVVLLKIIKTYPWILEVAQSNFEPIVARNVFIKNSVSELLKIIPIAQQQYNITQLGVAISGTSAIFYQKFERNDNYSEQPQYEAVTQIGNTEQFFHGSINSNAIALNSQSVVKSFVIRR